MVIGGACCSQATWIAVPGAAVDGAGGTLPVGAGVVEASSATDESVPLPAPHAVRASAEAKAMVRGGTSLSIVRACAAVVAARS